MFCSECGAENELGSKFCSACGKPLKSSENLEKSLIARILLENQKEKRIAKGATKTSIILKVLYLFLFCLGSVFILVSYYFATVPFLIVCIVCYCVSAGLATANGLLIKNSKNLKD